MKRWILLLFFFVSLGWGIVHYGSSITQGTFSSIILDFREEVGDSQIQQVLSEASQRFDLRPRLNSEFSESDHVFIVPGESKLLRDLMQSGLDRYTESIEPNYSYSVPEASQVRLPITLDKSIAANPSMDQAQSKPTDKSTDKFQEHPSAEPVEKPSANSKKRPPTPIPTTRFSNDSGISNKLTSNPHGPLPRAKARSWPWWEQESVACPISKLPIF